MGEGEKKEKEKKKYVEKRKRKETKCMEEVHTQVLVTYLYRQYLLFLTLETQSLQAFLIVWIFHSQIPLGDRIAHPDIYPDQYYLQQ